MNSHPALRIYIPDMHQSAFEPSSSRFREQLVAEFALPFEEADIGAGAAVQAFWTTLTEAWPFVAAAAVFFSGKKIEENIEAWQKLSERLQPFVNRAAVFDRDGAAVLAIDGLRLALGKLPDFVRLVGYKTDSVLNRLNDPPEEWQADRSRLSVIEPPLDRVQDDTIHFFQIEADRQMFKVVVQGSKVFVIKI